MNRIVIVALLVSWVGRAAADDPAPAGPTIIEGRATDVLGKPIANARVYVLPRGGQPIQSTTDRHGKYRVEVQTIGTHGVVIAIDKAHSFRTVLVQQGVTNALDIDVELDTSGGEVINIEDRKRPLPKVEAKPRVDPRINLPYSEEAVERDAWAKAWMLLDVDERGKVTRLKLIKAPGFDLDRICIEQALALEFEPARGHDGGSIKTYMLWTMEWPAWGWLVQGNGTGVRRPPDHHEMHSLSGNRDAVGKEMTSEGPKKTGGLWARPGVTGTAFEGALDRVPCAGSGPLNLDLRNRAYRDCSPPDLSILEALPWITPRTVDTAVAELTNPNLKLVQDKDYRPANPWPGYVGAGVSAALAIYTVYAFAKWHEWQDNAQDLQWQATLDPVGYKLVERTRDRWGKRAIAMTGVSILASGATLLLWNRSQKKSSFSVQPTESKSQTSFTGATATFARSF